MSRTEKESNVHKVKIQQTYWAKDTTEELITEMGAIRTDKVVEDLEYYDTDLYDLAVNQSWLSKTGKDWKLIIDKMKARPPEMHSPLKTTVRTKQVNPKSPNLPSATAKLKHNVHTPDLNGNTDPEKSKKLTCYEMVEEKEIIAHLSRILHIHVELDNVKMGNFLEMARIQKYTSVSNVTRETYRLRDIYTVLLKADGASTKKRVVISLDVEIDDVTQGFQRVEQLANELDLQPQHV